MIKHYMVAGLLVTIGYLVGNLCFREVKPKSCSLTLACGIKKKSSYITTERTSLYLYPIYPQGCEATVACGELGGFNE